MFDATDHRHMARALGLARRGLYSTAPNPRVGCVLARGERVVGEGWHRRAGEAHAELAALHQAGAAAAGATAYVTLEPCSHHGRTPPCSDALLRGGVARVIAAMPDSNPLVAGQGMARLRQAGVQVDSGLLASEARALNPGFVSRMERGRPFVRCKLAMSLDGRTAMASGESRWISGEASRRDVHRLRARSDAIITGIGTVLADDPAMTVRLQRDDLSGLDDDLPFPTPTRVVLDSTLRMPPEVALLRQPGRTLVFTGVQDVAATRFAGAAAVEVERVTASTVGLDLGAVLTCLAEREMNEVLVEAGPTVAGAFLGHGLVDELVIYMAPHVMGSDARGLFGGLGIERMAGRVPLTIVDMRAVGGDWRITAVPE